MPNKQQSSSPNPVVAPGVKMTDSARRAWTVKFVVPAPQSMPSERLKARAELVRNALDSGSCCSY